jgi:hypothetical protein
MAKDKTMIVREGPLAARPTVRLTLPASAAFNIGNLHKVIDNLAAELGHTGCFSGADCLLSLHKDYVVDPASLEVHAFGGR